MEVTKHQSLILKRADALDALRGIAVLAMVLSGVIPFDGTLPDWMYHAQFPPPNHQYNSKLAGLTWVDVVFPIFLFSLGAAIPLALSWRLSQGWNLIKISLTILKRGFFLASFAIILQHFRPTVINPEPGFEKWQIALIGFLILFLMFVQLPRKIPQWINWGVNLLGWGSAIAVLTQIQYPASSKFLGFSLYRSDIILLVITNVFIFTAFIWLFTRHQPNLRAALLAILFALMLSRSSDGWIKDFLSISPVPWLFQFDYLKYLFVAIPGTIIGDWLVAWQIADQEESFQNWNQFRLGSLVIIMILIILNLLLGLQTRRLIQTTGISIILLILGDRLMTHPSNPTEQLFNKLYAWGMYWLILGLAFEPYQGGIKKDSATMSYFFITTAIAIFLLIALMIVINYFNQKLLFQLFIDNGKNPMIGYVAFANLLWPILELTDLKSQFETLTTTPWLGFLRGVGYTLMIAVFVSLCTRLKLFWKT